MEPTALATTVQSLLEGVQHVRDGYAVGKGMLDEHRFNVILRQVARVSDVDPSQAAGEIKDALRHSWCVRLLEQTFRHLMDSIHSKAETAIAAMMAEYRHECRGPDREYQLAGGLLAGADEDILRGLLAISLQFVELHNMRPSATVAGGQVADNYTIVLTNDNELFAHRLSGARDVRVAEESTGQPCPRNLAIIVRLLERHEFGFLPTGASYSPVAFKGPRHPSGGAAQLSIMQGAENRLRRLHGYLLPALADL
jgi:hypothetical protein